MTELLTMDSFINVTEVYNSEVVTALAEESQVMIEVETVSAIVTQVVYNSIIV